MRCIWFVLIISLLASACGKKGALIYPDQLVPEAPGFVTLRQTGQAMVLSFVLPRKDLAGHHLTDLSGVKVIKREAIMAQGEECSNACIDPLSVFRTIYADVQDERSKRYGSTVVTLDSNVTIGNRYSYLLVPFTKNGVDGQKSAPVKAAMQEPPKSPELKAVSAPTEIILKFSGELPFTGTFLGYNLYRTTRGEAMPFIPLNKAPLQVSSYTDSGLDRHRIYIYGARTVVQMPSGEVIESILSNQAEAALKNEE